jgi:hypothetical protein
MKRHRIFNKGDFIYGLVSSQSKPNILIPVRGLIVDTKWEQVNPKYKIKILKFYDSMYFLKKHFFDISFRKDFKSKSRKMALKPEDYDNIEQLTQRLNAEDEKRFYIIIDSILCVKTKNDMKDLFNRIQFYIISNKYKEARELATRALFTGTLSVDSKGEWDAIFRSSWSNKFESFNIDINEYIKSLD